MLFGRLYCNGSKNPLGVGTALTLSWNYQGNGGRNEKQDAYRVLVTGDGEEFDSGIRQGDTMRFDLTKEFAVRTGKAYRWQVTAYSGKETVVSPEQFFETAVDDLPSAAFLTCGENEPASPVFEKTFSVPAKVRSARAYVTGVGLFTCACNEQNCSDAFLMPANTPYDTIQYTETFDITALVTEGENRFSVWLGNGYNADYSKYGFRYFGKKGFRCILVLTLENGETMRILSGGDWVWHDSPITENGLYAGETYDARRTEFAVYAAVPSEDDAPKGKLLPREMPQIRAVKEYLPIASWRSGEGTVYDFGCNLQGVISMEAEAPEGTALVFDHSEMLFPDGRPDPETNRRASARDTYICAGTGRERYCPRFTYHGFRYVTVTGAENASYFSIRALQLSADVEPFSTFQCSDATVNRIHALCCHSSRCNEVSIPTDCPVRDERTPCQMDSQMMEAAAMHNFYMESYYRKWLTDITCNPRNAGDGNPDWHGDYILLSYRMYRFYGDEKPLFSLYPRMMADVRAWFARSGEGIVDTGFGDWCLPNENTWESFFGCTTAVNTSLLYAYCCIMEETSVLLGNEENARCCREMKETMRAAFHEKCVHEDGTVLTGRQSDMILPLYYGLITEEDREKVSAVLRRKLEEQGHLDTGGFGNMALVPAMAYCGALDLIPEILSVGSYPGFGFWLANGATSMWEQWAVKGNMHSHSHQMHGGIGAAFYRVFCGLTTVKPGYRSFRVAPCMPKTMQFASCHLASVSGDIDVTVERLYDGLEISVRIPPNTEAEIVFPEWERYADCGLWDGERRIEKQPSLRFGSGFYQLRLVPERYFV